MEIFIDDRRVSPSPTGQATLADALRHVQTSECPPGRLVIRLRCDGQDVDDDAMVGTLRKNPASVSRLEVFTATRQGLVTDAMNQASASLQESEVQCRRVADLLTEGKTSAGMEALGESLRIWQQVHQAVTQSIEMLGLDVQQAKIRDEPMVDIISKPKDVLLQIRDALVHQDHVLLADLLQYELKDVTDQWFAILGRIREEAESAGPRRTV